MEYDEEKVDEMTLALLWLVLHDGGYGTTRAWKSFDWNTMDRLFKKGFISDPGRKTKSVGIARRLSSTLQTRFTAKKIRMIPAIMYIDQLPSP